MIIVMFTLVGDLNPYRYAGKIHGHGLDSILGIINSGWPGTPYYFDASEMTTDFVNTNYPEFALDEEQAIDPIAVKGYNIGISFDITDPTDLGDIASVGIILPAVEIVFSSLAVSFGIQFPGNNIDTDSYLLFTTDPINQAGDDLFPVQLYEILASSLSNKDMILPLIAQSMLLNSYTYWKGVYNWTQGTATMGTPGYNGYVYLLNWLNFYNGSNPPVTIADFGQTLDWRQLIQQDIKGGILGAMLARIKHPDHSDRAFIVGAAAAATASSVRNYCVQIGIGLPVIVGISTPEEIRRPVTPPPGRTTMAMAENPFKYNVHPYNTIATQKLLKLKKEKGTNHVKKERV